APATDTSSTSEPSPVSPPTTEPPPTPEPVPQILADTAGNFGTTEQEAWRYIWSPPDDDNWKPLSFEERRYGDCWYAEDYIRICSDSAHPGNGADVVGIGSVR
ncbi:MAG TPA: hypothetical protein P5526_23930, partial [Anaerolineae bacterium]|nr:hypothetical protein [Anaerolineae bacterium]